MKIVTIVGARPQFIKAATVSREISKDSDLKEIIVHTGQHYDEKMSAVFFNEMKIPEPDYNLSINRLSHGAMTGRMLEEVERILHIENPEWVVVYGDTNSTLAGALAASKLKIKVAHVEAGLRSNNKNMPEEINRILTDRISDVLFCPTDTAVDNLIKEGYNKFDSNIEKIGDVMLDAILFYKKHAKQINYNLPQEYVLATIHREENTNNRVRLSSIIEAFNEINKTIPVIFPLHPRTNKFIKKYNLELNFQLLEPASYLEMITLLERCNVVMTDSGGLQKEAFFFKKPCLTLRDQTEWVELINEGVNKLVNTRNALNIINSYNFTKKRKYSFDSNIFGTGNAAKKVVKLLKQL